MSEGASSCLTLHSTGRAGGRRAISSPTQTACWPRPGSTDLRASSPSGSVAHTCRARETGPASSTNTAAPRRSWSAAGHRRTVGGRRASCSHGPDRTGSSSLPEASPSRSPTARPMTPGDSSRPRPAAHSARSAHSPSGTGDPGDCRRPWPDARASARPDPPRRRSILKLAAANDPQVGPVWIARGGRLTGVVQDGRCQWPENPGQRDAAFAR
jgi:hypothetical protein